MSEKLISPAAMMDLLHAPYPEDVWADLETLRHFYRERRNVPLVQHIRSSLNHAIDEWYDEQVEDFWVNYLLEPPQLEEFRSVSAQERRLRLRQLCDYLFDTL